MMYRSPEKILDVIRQEIKDLYEEDPGVLERSQHIYKDLHLDEPDSAFALELRHRVAKRLGIKDSDFPGPIHGYDYTLGEIVDAVHTA